MKRLTRKYRLSQRSQKKNRKQETPVFERLEPRLLLNADITGLTPTEDLTIPADQTNNAIEVGITQSDSLMLTTATPQALPYSQDFSGGQPTDAQGWEYYSDSQGQIQVVSGQLLLDDYGVDNIYSLNEAILHLNLTDKKEVTLKLDHTSYLDENQSIPTSFSGHYKGDGIALSVDGVNWVKITDLTNSFIGNTYSLDSIIDLAKAAAGSNDISDVRIKFQQYDNTNGNDGRSFDNIQVTALAVQQLPYTQDFSSGKPTANQGWEYYSDNQGQIQVVGGRLRLDDSVTDYSYSLNEAILHVDLTGQAGVKLTLDQYSIADENDEIPVEYTGHYKGDGISISVDGIHWVRITNLSGNFTGQVFDLDTKITQAKALAGSNDVSNVRIKFQQYDNTSAPSDGREFDNIHITSEIVAQTAPYTQNFSSTLPTGSQGWEYYSTNQGQIQVVGGRLRLDDSVADYSYSSNEAILHVNLTNLKEITLKLDHWSLADEDNGIPASYSGHYKGDAISLSVDGINWIRITNLTNSFTAQTFALDAILEQAKAAAGSTDISNVRIKFQQYDNTYAPSDGREFDNIVVTGLAVQQVPYVQTFETGKPTQADGWEYYSTNQGQIQVVNGYLLLDDSVTDYTYSSNEAILHVDLTNKKEVVLSLDHTSFADENDALPSVFSGHSKGDGIAISVDGLNWVRVTNLTSSFINGSFNLDSFIEAAKTAAGSNNVSDVRIKFQQYDNTSAPSDGRSFDNINITAITVVDVPYTQNFDAGKPTQNDGWEYYSDNQGQIQVVDGRLRLDDSVSDYSYSSNEAILHVNLTNKNNVVLTLDHTSIADENTSVPSVYSGHYKGDAICLSIDGINWVRVTNLTSSFTGQSFSLDSIIAQAISASGSNDLSNVRIKFQQYDNTPAPSDGREFDNIHITADIAQTLPYTQDFSAGLPSAADGWEYYSDNQGQIQVVGGRLRMDDSVSDYSYSLNEAILHLDLTGQSNVTLTLDQYSIADENDALPANFTGHYKGDGISLSVDGIHWVTITNLTTSFVGQSFSLDSIITQAISAAGSSDLSNVRIKFQQYDNTSSPSDGREFDNIQITST